MDRYFLLCARFVVVQESAFKTDPSNSFSFRFALYVCLKLGSKFLSYMTYLCHSWLYVGGSVSRVIDLLFLFVTWLRSYV